MSRVLLLPFAPGGGLAHVGACLSVAEQLRARGHEATVGYGGTARDLVASAGIPIVAVREIPGGQSLGNWYAGPDDLAARTTADRALIERIGPDVVVTDLRLSATLACELAGAPDVSIMHFLGSSPYTRRDRRDVVARPSTWASRAYGAARSFVRRDAASTRRLEAILAEARARLGLPPRQGFPWDGRRVACTTTPRLDPTVGMPAHWHYVGPVTWSAPGPELDLSRFDDSRPLVYVTQGSTGAASRLRRAVRELGDDDVQLLVATAQLCDPAELARTPGVVARRYLPDAECSRRADLAVVHGGHLSASQAHVMGTPVVVLPATDEQRVWAARVERLGTGIALRSPVVPGAIRRGVHRVLGQPAHAEAASAIAEHLKAWPGARLTAQLVEDLVP